MATVLNINESVVQEPPASTNSNGTIIQKDNTKSNALSYKHIFDSYIFGTAEGLRQWCCNHGIIYVLVSCFFRGVGQVVFMDNPWTGLIMFIGLMYHNYYYALLGFIGGCTNYATAIVLLGTKYLHLPTSNYLNNGIFIYNGLLIGLMCGTFVNDLNTGQQTNGFILFLKLIPFCLIFSYIATSIHVGLTNMFPSFPVFTFPFNVSGFLCLALCIQVTWIDTSLMPSLAMDNTNAINNVYTTDEMSYKKLLFKSIFRGPVQVYLCSNAYIGITFIIAIAICDLKAAALALFGSITGSMFAMLISVDLDRIYFGLHSYNSTLTMVGIGCVFATLNMNNIIMAIFHSIICVLIELALITIMAPMGLPYLTLPFCLATMFFSVFAYRMKQEVLRRNRQNKTQKQNDKMDMKRAQSVRGAPIKLDNISKSGNDDVVYESEMKLRRVLSTRGAPIQLDVINKI